MYRPKKSVWLGFRFLSLLPLLFLTLAARAQSVHWEGSPDDPSEVQLVFDECSPDGDPHVPALADNVLSLAGNSSQTSIINGSFSRSYTLTYSVRAKRPGAVLQIPSFTVQTNKGPKQVTAYTGGAARVVPEETINSRLMPGAATVWAGEVFPVTYVINGARRSFSQIASNIDWNSAPLVVEGWPQTPETAEMLLNGEPRMNVVYRTRGYAKNPGTFTLNAATQLVNLVTGSIGFGLFQQPRVEQLAVSSKRPEIAVKPLLAPPAGFTGAVGQFKLVSKVVPTAAAVGEPVTWTLELSGTGNWPEIAGLPQREVSKDFQVVQPQAKRTPAEGKLFDAVLAEDVVLVPAHPGSYTLNPVAFVYFDPKDGVYKTLRTPQTAVTISPAAGASAPRFQVGLPEAAPSTAAEPAAARPAVAPPEAPSTIPRDPLPGPAHVSRPLDLRTLAGLMTVPFALLLAVWLWLAVQRARITDPIRTQREARARLAATLARLREAPAAERPALLLAWQHDSAVLWKIFHAAPAPSALDEEEWRRLWTESDRALYRAGGDLPPDWTARAEAALAAKRVRGFSPLSALRLRNLAPFVAAAALLIFAPPARSEDAAAAYRRGDFAAAEKSWSAEVGRDPVNPIARHNLSLSLAQQDRWDLALAHATAALVQSPGTEPIRWQFALAAEKAGFVPAPLAAFPKPGPLQALARQASPAGWQRLLIAAAALAALSLGFLLAGTYRGSSRRRSGLAAAGLALSMLTGVSAVAGVHAYGQAADSRAVIVWRGSLLRSIPTEADTSQKSTTLAAGSVAVVDRTFLGWVRLSFDNSQTGWVRKEDVVALWQ
ncbi:MAG: hypothetical protein JWM88_2852 [Verrucomicrobia bacterium]|nr:hypothetical protein [Verrucomicrobiota bacterium]